MPHRIIWFLVLALGIFFIITQPEEAADVVQPGQPAAHAA